MYICIIILFIFQGINRYLKDLEIMLGRPPFLCWKICWMFVSPIIICVSTHVYVKLNCK